MLASIDWVALGTMGGFVVVVAGMIGGTMRWANHHVVRPLKIVTGEPETNDDPGKPSLYQLTKAAKETGEKALAIAEQAREDVAAVRDQIMPSNGRKTAEIVEAIGKDVELLKAKAGIK